MAGKDAGARPVPEEVTALIAGDRCDDQHHKNLDDVEIASAGHNTNRKQKRIAGQEQAHQQSTLRENDTGQ